MAEHAQVPNPKPEDGAINPTARMQWAGWIGGTTFVVLIVVLALWVPNPTGFQEFAFRVPMSIGAAAFAAFVPGFLIVRAFTKKEDKQAGICGGGAIVVFVLLMYVNPARLGSPAANLLGTAPKISVSISGRTSASQPPGVVSPMLITLSNEGVALSLSEVSLYMSFQANKDKVTGEDPLAGMVGVVRGIPSISQESQVRFDGYSTVEVKFDWSDLIAEHLYLSTSKQCDYRKFYWYLVVRPAVGEPIVKEVSDWIYPAVHLAVLAPEKLPEVDVSRIDAAISSGRELRARLDHSFSEVMEMVGTDAYMDEIERDRDLDDAIRCLEKDRRASQVGQ